MVAKIIEPEVQQALECICEGKNFILTGGAGSGKTYSLVKLIDEIGNRYPLKSIICITYTNNAVAEIRNRITNRNLRVSTIHEFMWSIISKYQVEIKDTLVELINSEEQTKFRLPEDLDEITIDYFAKSRIMYDEYYSLRKDKASKISHDHVLILAEQMFKKYTKLCDILKDIANFIFVDEYQDTDPLIKDILLKIINQSSKKNIVGFFGDSMQAIYDNGVGVIDDENLVRIEKVQNRRNPESIIKLANKLRIDGLEQEPSEDLKAPNIVDGAVVEGCIKFIYAKNINDLDILRNSKIFEEWDFSDCKKNKELWLVHRLNAKMAGFTNLYELYNSDAIVDLIKRISKKVDKGELDTKDKDFETIVRDANISVKNRGNLLENIMKSTVYRSAFVVLKDKNWDSICNLRINKDSLLSYKYNGLIDKYEAKSQRDKILQHLDSVYELIELYRNKKYNEFLRKSRLEISSIKDKRKISNMMNEFDDNYKIEKVIKLAQKHLNIKDELFDEFINDRGAYLWERIKRIPFSEYVHSIEYQKEYLPFATQHSIKGSEFDNVLIVLDNGNWNNYNFERMFKDFYSQDRVVVRTKRLFYVCCTRAMKNLVVFMPSTDAVIIDKAKQLFGEANVLCSTDKNL